MYSGVGVASTIVLEGLHVYVWHGWSYAPTVPCR